jgi:hypothetical protein
MIQYNHFDVYQYLCRSSDFNLGGGDHANNNCKESYDLIPHKETTIAEEECLPILRKWLMH